MTNARKQIKVELFRFFAKTLHCTCPGGWVSDNDIFVAGDGFSRIRCVLVIFSREASEISGSYLVRCG